VRVVVLEARNRTGGRVRTARPSDGGTPFELGAQVIHGSGNPARAIVSTTAIPRDVGTWVVERGQRQSMGLLGRRPNAPWAVEAAVGARPSEGSVRAWMVRRGIESAVVDEWFAQNWAASPDRLDAPGVAARAEQDTGEFAVVGGFDRLPEHLADGVDVRLGAPVETVTWRPGQVDVAGDRAAAGERAQAVVLTVPPPVIVRDTLKIELPPAKIAAARSLPLGDACCALITLSHSAPESAVVFDADGRTGFVRCQAGRPYALIVAKGGAAAHVRADPTAGLATALPWATDVRQVEIADWGGDPWTTGAFTYPQAGDAGAVWAEPLAGTVFFAGEATAPAHRPFVPAAFASGERAAAEVLAALR
jgi:monoamine oxidase